MRATIRQIGTALLAIFIAAPTQGAPAVDARRGRMPVAAEHVESRCSEDGSNCIRAAHFVPDTCRIIERAARNSDLDPAFLARLIWRESRFDPSAVSPAGALGIAQFMPGTARILGLSDPLNPAQAILKSARYLAELRAEFGSIGMAAIAYNGGENRAARFLARDSGLPYETLNYVQAITGHSAEAWRDSPDMTPDLTLKPDTPFRDACIELARNRTIREFITPERVWPWAVIIATSRTRAGAQRQARRLTATYRPILQGKSVSYLRRKMPGTGRMAHTAQVGWNSRGSATRFCAQLRATGGRCLVLKN